MRGLVIIWEGVETTSRIQLMFEMALVHRALGGAVTLFVSTGALPQFERDSRPIKRPSPNPSGPELCALLRNEALEAGVRIIVCQSGLAHHKINIEKLDPRVEAGGLTGIMQGSGDDRLVVI